MKQINNAAMHFTLLGDWSSPHSGGATTSTLIRSGGLRRFYRESGAQVDKIFTLEVGQMLMLMLIIIICLPQILSLLCQHLPSQAEHCSQHYSAHVEGNPLCFVIAQCKSAVICTGILFKRID